MAQPLPIVACELDAAGMRDQAGRYARLGTAVTSLRRAETELIVEFGDGLDEALLDETLAIERGCCSFFGISYDASRRRLVVSVPDASQRPALDVLAEALSA